MRFRLALLALLIVVASSISSSHARGCKCPKKGSGFVQRFRASHTVVRAYVLQQWTSCHLCSKQTERKKAIRVYAMYTYSVFKSNNPGEIFYAQSFDNLDFCGVRLKTRETYMLNLDDPRKLSSASHWNKGWYVLDACQAHFNWKALNSQQQKYLFARVRRN